MSDRYFQHFTNPSPQKFFPHELAQENLLLRERLLKYEQINEEIQFLISKNVELEEILRNQRLRSGEQVADLQLRIREQQRQEAWKTEQILKQRIVDGEKKVNSLIKEYQGIIVDQIEEIKEKQLKVSQFQQELFQTQKILEIRNKEVVKLNEELYHIRTDINQTSHEKSRLMEDQKFAKKAMQNMEKELKKLREYNGEILNKLGKSEAEFLKKQKERQFDMEEKDKKLKKSQNYYEKIKKQNEILKKDNEHLKKEKEDLRQRQALAKVKQSVQDDEINKLNSKYQQLKGQNQKIQNENYQLKKEKMNLENQKEEAKNSHKKHEKKYEKMRNTIDQERERTNLLLRENQSQIKNLQNMLKAKAKELENIQKSLQQLNSEIQFYKAQLLSIQEENINLKEKNEILNTELCDVKLKNNKFQEHIAREHKRAIENEIHVQRTKQQNKSLQLQIINLNEFHQKQIEEIEHKMQSMRIDFESQRQIMDINFKRQKQKTVEAYELALREQEQFSHRKLDVLEKNIDEYRQNMEKSTVYEGKLHPKVKRFF